MFEDFLKIFGSDVSQKLMWTLVAFACTYIFYKLSSKLIATLILRAKGTEGDLREKKRKRKESKAKFRARVERKKK